MLTRPIQNTFLFLGLHARARDTPHEGKGCSMDAKKNLLEETYPNVDIATTRPNMPSGPIR